MGFSASDKQYNFVFDTSSDDSDAMPWGRERFPTLGDPVSFFQSP